jgi:hypothetical protein
MTAILIPLLIVAALGYALRSGRHSEPIVRHPYNNLYSDAAGARGDHIE